MNSAHQHRHLYNTPWITLVGETDNNNNRDNVQETEVPRQTATIDWEYPKPMHGELKIDPSYKYWIYDSESTKYFDNFCRTVKASNVPKGPTLTKVRYRITYDRDTGKIIGKIQPVNVALNGKAYTLHEMVAPLPDNDVPRKIRTVLVYTGREVPSPKADDGVVTAITTPPVQSTAGDERR